MHSHFLSLPTRRALFAKGVAIVAGPATSGMRGAHPDAALFAACSRFNKLEREKLRLLTTGDGEDDVACMWIARCSAEQAAHLDAMCAISPATAAGHRARAISYSLWDGGELAYRARVGGTMEDTLLHAMVRDISRGSGLA